MATEVNTATGKSQREVTRDLLKKTVVKQAGKSDVLAKSQAFVMPKASPTTGVSGTSDMPTFNYSASTGAASKVPLQIESYEDLPPVRTVKKTNRKTLVEDLVTKSLSSILESMGESMIEEAGGKFNLVEYTTINNNTYNVIFQHVVGESSMQIQCAVNLMDEESIASVTTTTKGQTYSQTLSRTYSSPDKLIEDLSGLLEVTQKACL
jgi:hypothetical protein